MKKIYLDKDWPLIFVDYYSGMSQREIERKYNIPIRTIQRYCKYIINVMLKNQDSFINKNIESIKNDIRRIV
jgi:hypothetical protein